MGGSPGPCSSPACLASRDLDLCSPISISPNPSRLPITTSPCATVPGPALRRYHNTPTAPRRLHRRPPRRQIVQLLCDHRTRQPVQKDRWEIRKLETCPPVVPALQPPHVVHISFAASSMQGEADNKPADVAMPSAFTLKPRQHLRRCASSSSAASSCGCQIVRAGMVAVHG